MLRQVGVASAALLLVVPSMAYTDTATDAIGTVLYNGASAYQSQGADGIKLLATNAAVQKANEAIAEKVDESIGDGFTTFDVKIVHEDSKTGVELLSVYGINKTDSSFLFNQNSIVNYDSRTAVNLGLGYRTFVDSSDAIVGVNTFYDHELNSNHSRVGLGAEWFTNNVSLSVNYYNAVSGNKIIDGNVEQALDGMDYRVGYTIPASLPIEIFAESYSWSESDSVIDRGHKLGIKGNLTDSVGYSIAYDNNDDGTNSASISISSSLGKIKSTIGGNLEGKLYKPVERENRIKKTTSTRGGIVVSGF